MLKLIQLGLTFSDEKGELPQWRGELCVWQFNFRSASLDANPLSLSPLITPLFHKVLARHKLCSPTAQCYVTMLIISVSVTVDSCLQGVQAV
jgi:hypothetical protein